MELKKRIINFLLCNKFFGWKNAEKKPPRSGQRVSIYGCNQIATYLYHKDRIDNSHAYYFQLSDNSVFHVKNAFWKEI